MARKPFPLLQAPEIQAAIAFTAAATARANITDPADVIETFQKFMVELADRGGITELGRTALEIVEERRRE